MRMRFGWRGVTKQHDNEKRNSRNESGSETQAVECWRQPGRKRLLIVEEACRESDY